MGLMDKLKAGAEQAKDLAGEAAARAKDEARDLQTKRELGQAYDELGKTVFDLCEKGELTHAESRAAGDQDPRAEGTARAASCECRAGGGRLRDSAGGGSRGLRARRGRRGGKALLLTASPR